MSQSQPSAKGRPIGARRLMSDVYRHGLSAADLANEAIEHARTRARLYGTRFSGLLTQPDNRILALAQAVIREKQRGSRA